MIGVTGLRFFHSSNRNPVPSGLEFVTTWVQQAYSGVYIVAEPIIPLSGCYNPNWF